MQITLGVRMIALMILYLMCSSAYIFMGISILTKDSNNKTNKLFFVICLNLSFWAFMYALMTASTDAEAATFYHRLSALSWATFSSEVLYFIIYLTKKERFLKKLWHHVVIFVPAVVSIYLYFLHPSTVNDFVRVSFGWTILGPNDRGLLWSAFFDVYYLSYMGASILLILDWGKKVKLKRVQRQSKVLANSFIISLIIGSITDIFWPLLGISLIPELVIVTMVITVGGTWYTVNKYRLMSLTTESVVLDVLKIMNEGLIISDQEGRIISVNRGALQLLGYVETEMNGQPIDLVFANQVDVSKLDRSNSYEVDMLSKQNVKVPVLNTVSVLFDDFGDELGTVFIFQNISEIKQVENELRNTHETMKAEYKRLQDLLNSLPGIVIVLGENHKVRFANRNYILEFGEREGEFCYDRVGKRSPCDNCLIEKVFHTGLPMKNEEFFLNDKIYEVTFQPFSDIDGSKLVIKTLYDITDRKEARQELLRLQSEMTRLERLNLVGQLAAGIAHEIRNPMTTIRGYLQLLGAKALFQAYGSTFNLMIEELDRANIIISEFLSLAKNSPTERQYQNINVILRHLYPLLEADTFTQNKQVVFEARETSDLLLNANEISQLVLNLCRNGLEAMQMGGTLTIRTYKENEYVVLSVEDEGCGIPSEYSDKLGTPFFTTKDNGTGLGLATCYSIAERHNAVIDFKSGSGWTAFFVRFPCAVN